MCCNLFFIFRVIDCFSENLGSGIADGGTDELRSAAQDAGGKKNYSSIDPTNQ
uniref:Variable large protein n=1 Tax=Meloidogyne hapla TaxID=6305 RepID=A0A1I8C352_MELHA